MIVISFNLKQTVTILKKIGLDNILLQANEVVMLNAYKYDKENFFSLQKITFKEVLSKTTIRGVLKKNFNAIFISIINQTENVVTVVMKQTHSAGFFPFLELGYWGFLFPITVTKEKIKINILVQKESVPKLVDTVKKLKVPYSIAGIREVNEKELEASDTFIKLPKFTKRQHEIVKYAVSNGYYEIPRRISAKRISNHFDISVTAVNRHLREAEAKAVKTYINA